LNAPDEPPSFAELNSAIVACAKCPRLRAYCARIARDKRRAYRDDDYWGRPVPGWGDPGARLLVVALAPAAHGANRTGRMFTGDRSGDFLFAALHRAGFASQPRSESRGDGLRLSGVYLSNVLRCAPPGNKPAPDELAHCRAYLIEELRLLKRARVILTLGRIAFDNTLRALESLGLPRNAPRPVFAHGATYRVGRFTVMAAYHPSQRNTSTGRLTRPMFDRILEQAKRESERSRRV
jgi:uracil-DNA glycosylase family 4